jgi:K+-transporting ATPase ATPase A chain
VIWIQIGTYLGLLLLLAWPLGEYAARALSGERTALTRLLAPLERLVLRLAGARAQDESGWKGYARDLLVFNAAGFAAVYALQRFQHLLPLCPPGLGPVAPHTSFNAAVSFATNTNWQSYGGETTLSHLTQMLGLTVQNFVSAATGIAVLAALVRGFARRTADSVGSFWTDLVRGTVHLLLPLSVVLAIALVSRGVVQTLEFSARAELLEPVASADGSALEQQTIALGPAASQVAIKQLGTNGGGFFNVNSAHPLENSDAICNLLESLAILLIPAALCFSLGALVRDRRQGLALLAAMLVMFVPFLVMAYRSEAAGTPLLARAGVDTVASELQPGGNMEGKELRFGIAQSAIWAVATTAASNGSVNAMHDSFTPLGGLVPLFLMQLGEVVFGGVGSGLYGLLAFAIIAVFLAGLMVGRTPEYLAKKIGAYEMKMASIAVLAPCCAVLLGTAVAVVRPEGLAGIQDPGPHGFSEVLYAFSSAGNNNGSAFAGLTAATPFYDTALALAMLVARYVPIVAMLAIAGSLARKKAVPVSAGTLPTHGPLFVALLIGTVLLVGGLTFFPALALGPIAEHLLAAAG